eukprot:scaffold64052_cov18-Tisochrysis_lutea.AAC.1
MPLQIPSLKWTRIRSTPTALGLPMHAVCMADQHVALGSRSSRTRTRRGAAKQSKLPPPARSAR